MDLLIKYSQTDTNKGDHGCDTIQYDELIRLAKSAALFKKLFKYSTVTLQVPRFDSFAHPFFVGTICWLLARRKSLWVDDNGNTLRISFWWLVRAFFSFCYEHLTYKKQLLQVRRDLDALKTAPPAKFMEKGTPVYLRSDLAYGFIAGGSLGHIGGVVNNFEYCGFGPPLFISTGNISTVAPNIEQHYIQEPVAYRNVRDVAGLLYNRPLIAAAESVLEDRKPSLLYHRSALNSYAGVSLALKHNIPYILEYNGSEVWISPHWGGRRLKAMELSIRIEDITFDKALLIVCVSRPLKDELVARGVPPGKILVNPNGVDEAVYRPDIDGRPVREKYIIPADAIIIGFIGTYGPWHGAEVLAQAFVDMDTAARQRPVYLMMIGDGMCMPKVRSILLQSKKAKQCVFTGIVPQSNGAQYMAACDILATPQVRNPDGTPFFGSPTKMFEYMAMGKAIIASDLDQLGEILRDGDTALLCEPGNIEALRDAMARLADDADLRASLGKNARQAVCAQYTWSQHTTRIFRAVNARLKGKDAKEGANG